MNPVRKNTDPAKSDTAIIAGGLKNLTNPTKQKTGFSGKADKRIFDPTQKTGQEEEILQVPLVLI